MANELGSMSPQLPSYTMETLHSSDNKSDNVLSVMYSNCSIGSMRRFFEPFIVVVPLAEDLPDGGCASLVEDTEVVVTPSFARGSLSPDRDLLSGCDENESMAGCSCKDVVSAQLLGDETSVSRSTVGRVDNAKSTQMQPNSTTLGAATRKSSSYMA